MRDLSRCRTDFKEQQFKARQQLNGFVLRHRHHWPRGKSRWTQGHWHWLEGLSFGHHWQARVLNEYLEAVRSASERSSVRRAFCASFA
jgi:transposase